MSNTKEGLQAAVIAAAQAVLDFIEDSGLEPQRRLQDATFDFEAVKADDLDGGVAAAVSIYKIGFDCYRGRHSTTERRKRYGALRNAIMRLGRYNIYGVAFELLDGKTADSLRAEGVAHNSAIDSYMAKAEKITASGRAFCRCCGLKIAKGESALKFPWDLGGCGSWTSADCYIHSQPCANLHDKVCARLEAERLETASHGG